MLIDLKIRILRPLHVTGRVGVLHRVLTVEKSNDLTYQNYISTTRPQLLNFPI